MFKASDTKKLFQDVCLVFFLTLEGDFQNCSNVTDLAHPWKDHIGQYCCRERYLTIDESLLIPTVLWLFLLDPRKLQYYQNGSGSCQGMSLAPPKIVKTRHYTYSSILRTHFTLLNCCRNPRILITHNLGTLPGPSNYFILSLLLYNLDEP